MPTYAADTWALAVDGKNVTVRGVESSPDVSFDDILDNLDDAVMAEADPRKGRFGLFGSLLQSDLRLKASSSGSRPTCK